MKILITGGAGFIGSHLTDRLLSRGDVVYVVDNYSTGRRDNLKAHPLLTMIDDTICDGALLRQLMHDCKPDVVVHAAAAYKDPSQWTEDAMTNVVGTAMVCQTMKAAGIDRLIYFQTALCYGLKPDEQPVSLGHMLFPGSSSYAISKTAGE